MPAPCSNLCTTAALPAVHSECNVVRNSGGINYLVGTSCDVVFDNPCDLVEWLPYLQDCSVRAKGPLVASMGDPNVTTQRIESCKPPQPTGMAHSLTFQDFAMDDITGVDWAFWEAILKGQSSKRILWADCNDIVYGLQPFGSQWTPSSFTIQVFRNVTDNNEELNSFNGTININYFGVFKPFKVDGISQLLSENQNFDCATSVYGSFDKICPTVE